MSVTSVEAGLPGLLSKRRVLLIDENPDTRGILVGTLQQRYEVIVLTVIEAVPEDGTQLRGFNLDGQEVTVDLKTVSVAFVATMKIGCAQEAFDTYWDVLVDLLLKNNILVIALSNAAANHRALQLGALLAMIKPDVLRLAGGRLLPSECQFPPYIQMLRDKAIWLAGIYSFLGITPQPDPELEQKKPAGEVVPPEQPPSEPGIQ